MGNQGLEKVTDGESTYSVLVFPGTGLPKHYEPMFLAQWKNSLRYGNEYFKLCDSKSFFENYSRYIETIINRKQTVIRVAVLSDDRDVALGWSCIEGNTLHYVCVQREQRNRGIAKLLVPVPIFRITHLTRPAIKIWRYKLRGAIFDPF